MPRNYGGKRGAAARRRLQEKLAKQRKQQDDSEAQTDNYAGDHQQVAAPTSIPVAAPAPAGPAAAIHISSAGSGDVSLATPVNGPAVATVSLPGNEHATAGGSVVANAPDPTDNPSLSITPMPAAAPVAVVDAATVVPEGAPHTGIVTMVAPTLLGVGSISVGLQPSEAPVRANPNEAPEDSDGELADNETSDTDQGDATGADDVEGVLAAGESEVVVLHSAAGGRYTAPYYAPAQFAIPQLPMDPFIQALLGSNGFYGKVSCTPAESGDNDEQQVLLGDPGAANWVGPYVQSLITNHVYPLSRQARSASNVGVTMPDSGENDADGAGAGPDMVGAGDDSVAQVEEEAHNAGTVDPLEPGYSVEEGGIVEVNPRAPGNLDLSRIVHASDSLLVSPEEGQDRVYVTDGGASSPVRGDAETPGAQSPFLVNGVVVGQQNHFNSQGVPVNHASDVTSNPMGDADDDDAMSEDSIPESPVSGATANVDTSAEQQVRDAMSRVRNEVDMANQRCNPFDDEYDPCKAAKQQEHVRRAEKDLQKTMEQAKLACSTGSVSLPDIKRGGQADEEEFTVIENPMSRAIAHGGEVDDLFNNDSDEENGMQAGASADSAARAAAAEHDGSASGDDGAAPSGQNVPTNGEDGFVPVNLGDAPGAATGDAAGTGPAQQTSGESSGWLSWLNPWG